MADAKYARQGARRFNLAAQRCEEERAIPGSHDLEILLCEAVVCYAFSVEVCFKAIQIHETGSATRGHDLWCLFSALTPATQNLIKTRVNNQNFNTTLQDASNSFQTFRYAYEHQAAGTSFMGHLGFLRDLSSASLVVAESMIP